MQKTISATVSSQDNGLKLEYFLKTGLHLSKKEISRAKFRENGICVNGKRQRTDALLKTGDLVEIMLESGDKTSGNLVSSKEDVCVLYEDNDVMFRRWNGRRRMPAASVSGSPLPGRRF